MSGSKVPAEPPPSYDEVAGSSSNTKRPAPNSSSSSYLAVPPAARRSMEDESRPLPRGWVRSLDPTSHHHFYVDTTKEPPRSIWIHPYDDEKYLSTLSSEERERVEQESLHRGDPPSKHDIMAYHTDEEDETSGTAPGELPPRPDGKGKKSFGRKFKDKVTGTTHEERERERKKRQEQEKQAYEYHQRVRQAMTVAQQTGEPQLIGKDRDGKDVYVEPPAYQGGYGGGGYGYNPYQGGVYSTPNARYIRPQDPYSRPYGRGYGGGYGMPLALGMGGGLMGGLLIGDMMGGGMGMGMGGMGMGGGF